MPIDLRRRPTLFVLLALALALAAPPAAAEEEVPRIASGDLLEIRVWREPDLSGEYRVAVDGLIQHVLAGALPAAGRTTDEVADDLRERLEQDYLREARISVAVVESAQRRASVLGAVSRPGPQSVSGETAVLDLVFAAGGLAPEASGKATLVRPKSAPGDAADGAASERRPIDVMALLGGDLSDNLPVRPGDMLVVESHGPDVGAGPTSLGLVRIVGEVRQPGTYPLRDAATALDALLAAGGLGEYASANRARVVRDQEGERVEIRVRLSDVLAGKEGANLALRDGDLLIVPESFF